ncbi:MAG: chorismate synthase [Erysipelotrichaceae bacterium]|nr:chorismate synthase [Erysipelotrichaceae bacterium]
MGSTCGQSIKLSLFGESHGEMIGVTITGLAPGIALDMEYIQREMRKRASRSDISTGRRESDAARIVSGYFNGYTTGTPLTILIENTDTSSKDYTKTKDILRPSHADYTAYQKYLGYQDYRGGGHFSGRLTAPLVAAGAICKQILESKGIYIGTHIQVLKDIEEKRFSMNEEELLDQVKQLRNKEFPVLEETSEEVMKECILSHKMQLDSIGGILESVIVNMPAGIGEPFFHSIESTLSSLLYSIPAVKGVEFGLGFGFSTETGSSANDPFYMEKDTIKTRTNHNGGINGGISNGMPIVLRTCIKPTPSIYRFQDSVNYATKENTTLQIEGRHDPAIIHRACPVVDCVLAIGILDLICTRYGYMWQRNEESL